MAHGVVALGFVHDGLALMAVRQRIPAHYARYEIELLNVAFEPPTIR